MGDIRSDQHRAAARIRQGGTVSRLPTEYSSRVPDRADSCGAAAAALQVTVEILRSATSRARLASLAEAQSSSTFDDA